MLDIKFLNKDEVAIIEKGDGGISFTLFEFGLNFTVTSEQLLLDEEQEIYELPSRSEANILAVIDIDNQYVYLHKKNNKIYLTRYLNGQSEKSIDLNIKQKSDKIEVLKTKYSYQLVLDNELYIDEIDYNIFMTGIREIESLDNREPLGEYIYIRLNYGSFYTFLEYTIKSESYSFKTSKIHSFKPGQDSFSINPVSSNQFWISSKEGKSKIFISKLKNEKKILISKKKWLADDETSLIKINKRVFVINSEAGGTYISYDFRKELLLNESYFKIKKVRQGFLVKGYMDFKYNIKLESACTKDGQVISDLSWKNDKEFTFLIPNTVLLDIESIHNKINFKLGHKILISMVTTHDLTDTYFSSPKILDGQVCIIRSNNNEYVISKLPESKMYTPLNRFKIKIAYYLSKMMRQKKINVYFEKESMTASESASYVFEEVMTNHANNSANYFILDKEAIDFPQMKERWGKHVVAKFSFKHYLLIFRSETFISSELSSHVLGIRVYNQYLEKAILAKPLYFLQHGIMFAKPIDNPMALGFHKENMIYNLKKSVVSSDLEAEEFYRMGYTADELMKTGLPKLDGAVLSPNADKIVFMPTWRYWEEYLINSGRIEETTYYQAIMEVIELFEERQLLSQLLITPHNKFSKYIKDNFVEYSDNLCADPTEALKVGKIFITDYSSAIYDSTYRGGVPIFYWKESDYLIEHYKAIPSLNEENAPGYVIKNTHDLGSVVEQIIDNDYKIESATLEKFHKINEFYDNKNTQRVCQYLVEDGII